MLTHPSTRHDIADGLKALALLGVFVVNGLGYALAPEYPLQLGAPLPIDSTLAQVVHAAALTFLMGKALPFLAFLFGYSMTLYAQRSRSQATLKRRQWKLLLVGIVHGTLFYFGDILTCYALVGLWLTSSIKLRGRALLASWRWLAALGAATTGALLWWNWQNGQPLDYRDWANAPQVLMNAPSYGQFVTLNASAYLWQTFNWFWALAPLHMCLFVTGILAARYRWLSMRPRIPASFSHPFFYSCLSSSWPLALLANALSAIASVHLHSQYGLQAGVSWIAALNIPLGLWLAASCVFSLMRHIQTTQTIPAWLLWLAPSGRHTLAMYLVLSALLVLSGRLGLLTSLSVWNHTAVWFVVLLLIWLVAISLGRGATAKQMRDPISKWLSR